MPHPTEARQLPGVKGQWILCSDCPPTKADVDHDEDVRIYFKHAQSDSHFCHFGDVRPDQYWCPADAQDPRPFTLPAAPAPEQAAAVKRKFVQLVTNPQATAIYAVADDGTAWISSEDLPAWIEMADLPTREVSDA
jgi:hypothetical protein